jgi:hypothetical protein
MSDHEFTAVADIKSQLPLRRTGSIPSAAISAMRLFNVFLEWFGSLGIFSWRVFMAALSPPFEWREFIRSLTKSGRGLYRWSLWRARQLALSSRWKPAKASADSVPNRCFPPRLCPPWSR